LSSFLSAEPPLQIFKIPQIWHDYMLEPELARKQRKAANVTRLAKKKRAAELKKQKAAAKKKLADDKKKSDRESAQQQHSAPRPATAQDVFTATSSVPDVLEAVQEPMDENVPKLKHRCRATTSEDVDSDDEDEELPSCLHPNDPANFLKLCRALCILIGYEVTDEQIDEADILLREYCCELVDVFFLHLCHYAWY